MLLAFAFFHYRDSASNAQNFTHPNNYVDPTSTAFLVVIQTCSMIFYTISCRRSDNTYDPDDGYQDVSASVAARGLQAESGPMAEPDYAQVDMSKKKRNKRPVTDEYAQVDKSKKSKKPRKVYI